MWLRVCKIDDPVTKSLIKIFPVKVIVKKIFVE
jgi:hypothetical protein